MTLESAQSFARVAIPVPLGQAFSYLVPAELAAGVRRGARVLCEFGKRRVLGVVLDVGTEAPDVPPEKLKPLRAVVDSEPVLPDELLSFLQELARYYIAPIGEVIELALPAVERTAAEALSRNESFVVEGAVGRMIERASAVAGAAMPEKLKGNALALLEHLRAEGPTTLSELSKQWSTARAAVKKLIALGVVTVERVEAQPDPFLVKVERDTPPELTEAQAKAVARITLELENRGKQAFLLDGVTASGKTEVYLRIAARALELERGAIVLVPEIALTPQLVTRFRARLGDRIAVLHSGLSDRERHSMWRALRRGELRVAVGARSALFAPVQALGLICVDEEHDGSFKQEEGVRYHARDMALLRAHRAGAVCVLGSATPSLASIALVQAGRMETLKLPARARANAVLPEVEVVDLRRVGPGPGGDRLLSLSLYRALQATLERREQTILFLNRRGFSPSLICGSCGKLLECPNCSVSLTLHRSRGDRLHCHYCDYSVAVPERCAECKAPELMEEGSGTERIEATLASLFPSARIARLDRDVAAGAKSERILERMRAREVDILVGTQMVTKGHDLPGVTLVGVLNADAALSLPDFRAAERSFHLLVQVAGRAGRGDTPGRVLIQTRQPEHPAIAFALRHDVPGFIEQELRAREELRYPPFSRLALVRFDAVDEGHARSESERVAAIARASAPSGVELLGPAPAPLARLRNRYRYRFLLRAVDRKPLREALLAVARASVQRSVRMAIDVDPVSML
ncbi:MAG TPA: primosomal protein N' [Polyangiaceae bacterium]|nr:primosomal protein N' [Polyangiaceae bacterium]